MKILSGLFIDFDKMELELELNTDIPIKQQQLRERYIDIILLYIFYVIIIILIIILFSITNENINKINNKYNEINKDYNDLKNISVTLNSSITNYFMGKLNIFTITPCSINAYIDYYTNFTVGYYQNGSQYIDFFIDNSGNRIIPYISLQSIGELGVYRQDYIVDFIYVSKNRSIIYFLPLNLKPETYYNAYVYLVYNGFQYKSSSQVIFMTNSSFVNQSTTYVNISQENSVTLNINISYNYLLYDIIEIYYCFFLTRKIDNFQKKICNVKNYDNSFVRNDILSSYEFKTLWSNTTYEYYAGFDVKIYNRLRYECWYQTNTSTFTL
jgi:hypothetical protein